MAMFTFVLARSGGDSANVQRGWRSLLEHLAEHGFEQKAGNGTPAPMMWPKRGAIAGDEHSDAIFSCDRDQLQSVTSRDVIGS
jgi:hypothetical protein